jgi:flavin-binding protein dodecin
MLKKEETMSVAKVSEIISSSSKSFEDAVQEGIKRANKTLENVSGAWIKDQKIVVKNGKITEYRVIMRVTFVLKD